MLGLELNNFDKSVPVNNLHFGMIEFSRKRREAHEENHPL